MSSKILGNVWDACAAYGVKGAKLMIMARLADYSNDDGVCYRVLKPYVDSLDWEKVQSERQSPNWRLMAS